MAHRSTRRVFEVPLEVVSLARVLAERDSLDGQHLWVLGILCATEEGWHLEEEGLRLALDIAPEVGETLKDPLCAFEGRRCAAQGALIARSDEAPFLVVGRVVTASSFGIRVD